MKIQKIKLTNIRSYSSQEILFPAGSVLLSGDIGSGKTTILLAIEFALFGIVRGEFSPEHLLRHGSNNGSVEVTFSVDGKEYLIHRKLKRGKNAIGQDSGYLISNGEKFDATAIELKAKILDILGYPPELLTKSKSLIYRYTVFTPQEQMKRILTDQAEYRLDTLRKVFCMDKYKNVGENAEIVSQMLREKIIALSATISTLSGKKQQMAQQQEQQEQLAQKIKTLIPNKISLEQQKTQIEKTYHEIEQNVSLWQELKKTVAIIEATLQQKTLRAKQLAKEEKEVAARWHEAKQKRDALVILTGLAPLAVVQDCILEEEQLLQDLLSEQAGTIGKKKSLEQERHSLERRMLDRQLQLAKKTRLQQEHEHHKKISAKKGDLGQALEELGLKIEALSGKLQTHQVHIQQAQQLRQSIVQLQDCPTCLQPVLDDHKQHIQSHQLALITEHSEKLKTLEQEKNTFLNQREETHQQHETSRQAEMQALKLHAELIGLQALEKEQFEDGQRFEHIGKELAEIQKIPLTEQRIIELKEKIAKDRRLLEQIQKQSSVREQQHLLDAQIAEYEKRAGSIQQQTISTQQEIEKINAQLLTYNEQRTQFMQIEQEHEKTKAILEQIRKEYQELQLVITKLETEYQGIQKIVVQLQEECKQGEAAEKKQLQIKQLRQWLTESFCNVLGVMEKQVMARVHQEFSSLFQQWFSTLIEDELLSARLDDTFNPIIEQNGYETTIESLSGGEKTALALAYRLALNKVINRLMSGIKTRNVIILDEPTEGFSHEQLDRVREVLDQLGMEQVLIVSHETKMESFVDHIVRIGKHGHESRVL